MKKDSFSDGYDDDDCERQSRNKSNNTYTILDQKSLSEVIDDFEGIGIDDDAPSQHGGQRDEADEPNQARLRAPETPMPVGGDGRVGLAASSPVFGPSGVAYNRGTITQNFEINIYRCRCCSSQRAGNSHSPDDRTRRNTRNSTRV